MLWWFYPETLLASRTEGNARPSEKENKRGRGSNGSRSRFHGIKKAGPDGPALVSLCQLLYGRLSTAVEGSSVLAGVVGRSPAMAGSVSAVYDSGCIVCDERATHEQVRGADAAA